MNIPEKIFDAWWKVVLLLGVLAIAAGLTFRDMEIVNPRNLIGLGLGMVIIGFAYWIAHRVANVPYAGGMLSAPVTIHTPVTKIMLAVGVSLVVIFLTLLIVGLLR